jgi:hypothetical protein
MNSRDNSKRKSPEDTIRIFVSYCYADIRWAIRGEDPGHEGLRYTLIPWLQEQLKNYKTEIWCDPKLKDAPYEDFAQRIQKEIALADIALPLLSEEFANAQFIEEYELPPIKQRHDNGDTVVLAILVGPISKQGRQKINWLFRPTVLPSDVKPLLNFLSDEAEFRAKRVEVLEALRNTIEYIRTERGKRSNTTFKLTVNGGSGSGSYSAGGVAKLSADRAPVGKAFDLWVGAPVTDPTAPQTTLTMPASDVQVSATYKSLSIQNASLRVTDNAGAVLLLKNPSVAYPEAPQSRETSGIRVKQGVAEFTLPWARIQKLTFRTTKRKKKVGRMERDVYTYELAAELKGAKTISVELVEDFNMAYMGGGGTGLLFAETDVGEVKIRFCDIKVIETVPAGEQENEKSQPETMLVAKDKLLRVLTNLKRTTHNPDPYAVSVDLTNNLMTMENHQTRWEFNLHDLDPDSVKARGWFPGPIDARTGNESCQILADCLFKQPLVKWWAPDGKGGRQTTPSMRSDILFEVYQGEGDKFGRATNAENEAVESLRTLIRYFSVP